MIVLTGPLKSVDRVAISPDGAHLVAAGGTQKRLAVWSLREPGQPHYDLHAGFDRRYWNFCINPVDGLLLIGDNTGVTAYDLTEGDVVWTVPARNEYECVTEGLDVSRDGRELIAAVGNGYRAYSEFQRWELKGCDDPVRKRGARGPEGDLCRGVAFLPGTNGFVSADDYPRSVRMQGVRIVVDNRVRLRVVTGRTVQVLTTEQKSVQQLAVSRDGRFIAAQFPRLVLVWTVGDLNAPPTELVPGKRLGFTGIAFHPSGKFLAATSNDATVKLYDTETWQVARTFTWEIGRMRSVAFSPDGTLAAAGSDTGKVVVWDADV